MYCKSDIKILNEWMNKKNFFFIVNHRANSVLQYIYAFIHSFKYTQLFLVLLFPFFFSAFFLFLFFFFCNVDQTKPDVVDWYFFIVSFLIFFFFYLMNGITGFPLQLWVLSINTVLIIWVWEVVDWLIVWYSPENIVLICCPILVKLLLFPLQFLFSVCSIHH